MESYDHGLIGATVAVAIGAHRRHGWPVVLTASLAGMLPDWDGVSRYYDPASYPTVHRVWGHSLLVALPVSALLCAAGYLALLSAQARRPRTLAGAADSATPSEGSAPAEFSGHDCAAWAAVGALVGLVHVFADLLYSGVQTSPDWPVALLWPVSRRRWALPMVPWSDRGVTLILLATWAAMLRWPGAARLLAGIGLLAAISYVAARGMTARLFV